MAFLSGYSYRRPITLDYTKFSSTLTDFPLLVKLTEANFDFSKLLTANGLDVRFTSDDGETLLKFEREFYGEVYGTDFCNGGTATASNEYSATYGADKAFDNSNSSWWSTNYPLSLPHWLKYDLGSGITKIARKLTISPTYSGGSGEPVDFKLQGSNNDSTWTDILTITGEAWPTETVHTFYFSNSVAYRYYRLYVTTSVSNTYVQVKEMELMEVIGQEAYYWVKVPSISNSTDTTIYVYFGKTSDTDGSDKNNVWDSYHKGVYHLSEIGNGTNGEFKDSTANNYHGHGGYNNTALRTPSQVDFIAKGQHFSGSQEIQLDNDDSGLELGVSDFTISFKTKIISDLVNNSTWFGRHTNGGSYFYFSLEGGNLRFRDYDSGEIVNHIFSWPGQAIGVVFDFELVRNGTNFYCYVDGTQIATWSSAATFLNRTVPWIIGSPFPAAGDGYNLKDGNIDEFRFSIGIDRGSAWRNARISSDNDDVNTIGEEQVTDVAPIVNTTGTILLADEWSAFVDTEFATEDAIIYLTDAWGIALSQEEVNIDHTILLTDSWAIALDGIIHQPFLTKLYTTYRHVKQFLTQLRTSKLSLNTFDTDLRLKLLTNDTYKTDLRLQYVPYDTVILGTLNDFVVKLDGVELVDVDYSTLNITLNLNTTPSRAEFVLGRRHDNLDETLAGGTSVITAENKIEVFDGTTKLFTGYISEIEANSSNDTVRVTAEDVRRKLSRLSMELEYGGAWQKDSNQNGIPDETDPDQSTFNAPNYIHFEKNIYAALNEVVLAIGSYISGIDSYPFPGSFVPEYVKSYNDYVSLFDELIRQTATVNWYVDENERIRFQKVAQGTIKTLPLASLNIHRHPYDLIIDDIRLNKMGNGYARSLNVKRGKDYKNLWRRHEFSGWINVQYVDFFQTSPLTEFTSFTFQKWRNDSDSLYVGINQTIYGYADSQGWSLLPIVVVQWQDNNTINLTNVDLSDITVGSGLPRKTIYLTSYGRKDSNVQWSEELKEDATTHIKEPWLVYKTDEKYDRTGFVLDLANFELAQNNKLQTSATISMILDAYKYYNLSMMDLINLTNTIKVGIYKDSNGFPLNIESVSINCANRTVTMNCTNYGKSYYAKTSSIMTNYEPPKLQYIKIKSPVQHYSTSNT